MALSQQQLPSTHQLLVPTLPGHTRHTCTGPVYLHLLHWSFIHLTPATAQLFTRAHTHRQREQRTTASSAEAEVVIRSAAGGGEVSGVGSHIASSAGSRDHVTVPSVL